MRGTTTYKYPASGTRNGRIYPPEVLKKAFAEPKFKHLCDTKSIPVVEYDHDQIIGFATASLEDGNVTTVDASIFDPVYVAILKELTKPTTDFGFTLAGTGEYDVHDDKTFITNVTFDRAYLFKKDLAVDCYTTIHKVEE